jgi:hypothetical protein
LDAEEAPLGLRGPDDDRKPLPTRGLNDAV